MNLIKLFFKSPEFDGQLCRTISYTYYQGADIGECLATASRIEEGNGNSWFKEWYQTSENLEKKANKAYQKGQIASATECYLRASNYYRNAFFFLSPDDPHLIQAYDRHVETFAKGTHFFPIPPEEVLIPFEGTTLPGYFYKTSSQKAPTLIASNGYDSTQQECYFMIAAAALKRGYHVLCFDGPGQGAALIKQQLYMRPNWETVMTPVIDFLLQRRDVDASRIALYGPSWGGYLAPRSACFEHRLAALVANPGQISPLKNLEKLAPNIVATVQQNQMKALEVIGKKLMSAPIMKVRLKNKMWVHGLKTPGELIKAWKDYSLEGIAEKIQCPTLVMDAESESLSSGQAQKLYQELQCTKDYILLTNAQGAGGHCGGYGIATANQTVFDWLDDILKK